MKDSLFGVPVERECLSGTDKFSVLDVQCSGMAAYMRQELLKQLAAGKPRSVALYRALPCGTYELVEWRGKKRHPTIEEAPFVLVMLPTSGTTGELRMMPRQTVEVQDGQG